MIPQKQAIEYVSGIREIQELKHKGHKHSVPEWLLIIRGQLRKAEDAFNRGDDAEAFQRVGHVTACGLAAIEQNGHKVKPMTPTAPVYDKAYFIAKFEAIPDELWCVGSFRDALGRCCALGHCRGMRNELTALCSLLPDIDLISDGHDPCYPQPTPKARVLAALRELKD